MSWITEYVRPKIRGLLRRDVPDNLWTTCDSCSQMVLTKELRKAQNVCPHCGHHMRVLVNDRLAWTFDNGEFTRIELPLAPVDPLGFRDQKKYTDRLKDARAKSHLDESLVVAHGTIGGHNAVVGVMAFEFMAGTMGAAFGERFVAAARLAILQKSPLVVFTASGGARMQEGVLSLMQMPRTTVAVQMLRDAGLPYIVVLTNPTTGGVTASFAMLGDVQIGEPNALIGFAGPRVIQDTVREKLPEGFQRSEYLVEHGMLDMVVARKDMPATLSRLIGLLTHAPADVKAPPPKPVAAPAAAAE
ncbi:acetyl-CoA carboxylase carboxyltransferase subunit beta [Acetobacter fabarum]|jgi:acetyl-CoA carboxylase carboxyl transferase subunit beta|uniref:Acetyl-coenzyme A carboxylase carboxyl transferase subunit beta n=3 Tax=Acetobacter TaxID=434 RepID=A0A841QGX8_9PROT|nr:MULTISPECIES: acetyl-CoA carboxylase, carboxyltransferase subunit beta [Acetobacter]MBB6457801.1 acetyl-CoA carboxylase carboxyl transferase subunit beta [Acetobacter lovaniensis]MCH4025315.1 acetyl-CoA carboxylase, carboxyltransferase subunit beta [Acetobacter fabarum]MCH4128078.1 acetyl-CoA carboxylase, carboxyltransferase subunit beta [Acetobacter fabarum]MCH4141262.1 acetyl-CoA carboxylase, carboxyltransferase subunit beta [Acetobacter fabarum]MCI1243859.1 acetyl-CoA carboxylase, carbox